MWYVRGVLYAVLYVRVSCFDICGYAVSRRYINVCNCDMFTVVNVYLDHLKFCVVCINVCCSSPFSLVLLPRDSCVAGWRPLVCSINLTVLPSLDEPGN